MQGPSNISNMVFCNILAGPRRLLWWSGPVQEHHGGCIFCTCQGTPGDLSSHCNGWYSAKSDVHDALEYRVGRLDQWSTMLWLGASKALAPLVVHVKEPMVIQNRCSNTDSKALETPKYPIQCLPCSNNEDHGDSLIWILWSIGWILLLTYMWWIWMLNHTAHVTFTRSWPNKSMRNGRSTCKSV
jgi:hypothetical protein